MREWNPLWLEPDDVDNAGYSASIRRMIMASVNWIEAHPNFRPNYRDETRATLRAAGFPDTVATDRVAIVGNWEDVFKPADSATRAWFRAMDEACGDGGASARMMGKSIAAGCLLLRDGWDEFNAFMLSEPEHGRTRQ